ncbi:hypothetical protein HTY52_13075 [Cupriavidus taiwanensis]|uniref:hypothetical protein n=1 Tax=Cupriavidus taiwanensis TaxID=164546 RepID=UPI001571D1AC|nr:hypothetical protein [Cupriavidus taiwanensis]NSX15009.1 hypothetical protein [Cupriavidus taiwanensis]
MIVREVTDLFGEKVLERVSEARPGRKPTQPKGYAAMPGTGPEGEKCQTCRHKASTGNSHARVYWKCALMRNAWTGGPGTDIRMRSPACNRWEAASTGEMA